MSSTLTIGGKTVQDITIGAKQVQSIYDNTNQVLLWERIEDIDYFRITNTSDTSGVFTIKRVGSPTTSDLKYSSDGVDWVTADLSTNFSLGVGAGENVYMKGTNTSGFNRSGDSYYKMSMDVNHSIGGNIMSIVDETNYSTLTSVPNYSFNYLFYGDTQLVNAGDMNFGNFTNIGEKACQKMFSGCNSLEIPADISNVTSIGVYGCSYMYDGCTSLTTPAALSNVTSIGNYGCCRIYKGCTSLTTATDLSNFTRIDNYAYVGMYEGCTSLTTPSDLSNVTSIGLRGCFEMYRGCTSLTTPSDLSNVTSIGESGCYHMYDGCTSLTTAIAPNVSTWETSKMNNWLYNVASTGVVRKPAGLEIPTDSVNGVPSGWTTQDY